MAFNFSKALRKRATLSRNIIRWQVVFFSLPKKRNLSFTKLHWIINETSFWWDPRSSLFCNIRTFAKILNTWWGEKNIYSKSYFMRCQRTCQLLVSCHQATGYKPDFPFFSKLHDLFFEFLILRVDKYQDWMCKYVSHLPTGTWQVLPRNSSCVLVVFT